MAQDPISEVDDNQLDRVHAVKKAQEAMGQPDQQKPDVPLATTLALLGPALQSLSKIEHHKHGHAVALDIQTPAQLFASSKSSQLVSYNPEAPVSNVNTGESGANKFIQNIGSSPDPSGSGPLDNLDAWRKELNLMLKQLNDMIHGKHKNASKAINYITEKLLPFMGSYKQWEMSGEGVTMQNITKLNNDWNQLKDMYNKCDGTTGSQGDAIKLIKDMRNIINNDPSLKKALGDGNTGDFSDAIKSITGGNWENSEISKYWQQDWKKRSSSGGSGPAPGTTPDSTILTNFSQITVQLNNTSAGAQGAFKQDNSDYNTFNQVLTQTLKDLTSQYNYFNQKMTGS